MRTVWRAGDFAAAEREDSFLHAVAEAALPYEYPPSTRRILNDSDRYDSASVGALRVSRFRLTQGQGLRSPRLVRRHAAEECTVYVTLSGQIRVDQFGRQAAVETEGFTLVDLSKPYRVDMNDANSVAISFPRALLPLRDKDIRATVGTTFDRKRPGAALVTSAAREIVSDLGGYAGPIGGRVGITLLDLIAATVAAQQEPTRTISPDARRRMLLARICAFIEENLGDPDLAPPMIAARHYISLRHLYTLFDDEDTTVGDLIRSRRLARCRSDLLDAEQHRTPVSAIGARWGFPHAAHFSRLFRAEYGVPPSQYRALWTGSHQPHR